MHRIVSILCFLLVFCLAASGLFAQNSSLTGVVQDPQKAVVPGATVTIINLATGNSRSVVTGDEGRYLFAQVPPGIYDIRAELEGFKTAVVKGVSLVVDTPTRLDLVLELGAVSEIVTVSAAKTIQNTVDATLGNAFDEKQIVDLPLNSRNVVNLLTLQPGVTSDGAVSGSRQDQSNLTLDGIDVNDQQEPGSQPGLDPDEPGNPQVFTPVLRVTPDSVQEFRVTVSNPSAAQGRSAGGQVSLITKAGTNEWHGSLYEFHRNTVTTANNFFNNRNQIADCDPSGGRDCAMERPALIRNLFGGSVGGPIVKDKAFFFFNYEGRRDRSQESVLRFVPLPHLGRGELRYIDVNGDTVTLTPADIAALYPETGGINPIAAAAFADAASRYQANDHGDGDQVNTDGFRFNASTPLNQNTYIGKLDFNLSDTQTLFVRGNYQWDTQSTAPQFPDTPAPTIWSHPTGIAVGDTWTVRPTLINTFRFGLTRQAYSRQGDTGENYITFRGVYQPVLPARTVSRITPTYNITNDTSWIKGRHTVSFGTNIRFVKNSRDSFGNAFDDATSNGFFYPPGSLSTDLPDLSGGYESSYVLAAAALLGRFPEYSANFTFGADGALLAVGTPSARTFQTEEYEFYIEDSWQATQNLTVNYGLRWGINTPVRESTGFEVAPTEGLGDFFDRRVASAAAGTPLNDPVVIDTAGPYYGKKGYYDRDLNNFAPRVSAAWSPSFDHGILKTLFGDAKQSVFRGGFAMAYDRVGSALAVVFDGANTLGFNSSTTISANTYNVTDNLAPLFTGFGQDIRNLPGIDIPDSLVFPLSKPLDGARRIEGALDSTITTPVNYSWNFSIGRELPGGLFIEASYLGRRVDNLLLQRDVMHPNNLFDPASGMTFYEAARILADARQANTAIDQIPAIPYFENLFGGQPVIFGIDQNTTQDFYRFIARTTVAGPTDSRGRTGRNFLDFTFLQDVINSAGLTPDLFFHPQYGAFIAWSTIGHSDYHGFTLTARERFHDSLQLDINYTWSKSMDEATALQNASLTQGAALVRNALHPEYERSVSDFDVQHIINANWVWDLPVGRGRSYGSGMSPVLDALIGGWAFNGVFRWNSGLPFSGPFESGRWNTNWQISNNVIRIRDPRADPHKSGDEPNYWADSQYAYNSFRDTYAGEVGDRNVYRGQSYIALDFGLHKSFTMPYNEGHKVVFRWEVFNATNTQRLDAPSTNGVGVDPQISTQRTNFGIITAIQGQPRVMQFGLRYEF